MGNFNIENAIRTKTTVGGMLRDKKNILFYQSNLTIGVHLVGWVMRLRLMGKDVQLQMVNS